MSVNLHFYTELPRLKGDIERVVENNSLYKPVPGDWTIIVTDVENSTQAVDNGKQQEVNLAATGSIVACLNIARPRGIDIPFFFGGDGATLVLPEEIKDECLDVLRQHSKRCKRNFGFKLRVGSRELSELYRDGSSLSILRFQRNKLHTMPIVTGDALKKAEKSIKQKNSLVKEAKKKQMLNLQGMECKWDKIQPPEKSFEVVSYIINATDVSEQSKVYASILRDFRNIYGTDDERSPLIPKHLNMVHKIDQIKNEVKMKYNRVTGKRLATSYGRNLVGRFYLKYMKGGKQYVNDLIQLTETLLLDGAINTVVSGNEKQRELMINSLNQLEGDGKINYGYHISQRSVISCYVIGLDDYHIHFLDGEDGGYTRAAKVLKRKLAQ
jgi:hypothetical protein